MSAQLLTLETWAQSVYGEAAPALFTLRRWARNGHIAPVPEKHGRTYYVKQSARYVSYSGRRSKLVDRIRE